MGLRFRKSVKIAPGVRLNLNKNSTSVSFGGKGAHYTVSSNGRRTASVGIPGTGISYSASTSSGKGGKAGDRQPIFSFAFNASCSTPEKFTCASSAASFSHAGMLSVFLTGFCCFL